MKKIEITLHIEPEEFVIEKVESITQRNMLLMKLKNMRKKNEK